MSLLELGHDMIYEILIRLKTADLKAIGQTCKQITKICDNDYFWQRKYQVDAHLFYYVIPDLVGWSSYASLTWKDKYISDLTETQEMEFCRLGQHHKYNREQPISNFEPIDVPESVWKLFLTI